MSLRAAVAALFAAVAPVVAGPAAGPAASGDAATPAGMQPPALLGFTQHEAAAQLALEREFDAGLDARDLHDWMQRLSSAPNHVGSPHGRDNAFYVRDLLRSWGWQARIETFSVLYPTPKHVSLELLGPTRYQARLVEALPAEDASSAQVRDALPPYNVYGADGDVTGELVYVNEGMPADYLELERQGVSVRGRIVIVRYGGGWRGLKPKLAHEHGAIGCIIYSDPHEDGFFQGDVYPVGGWRPADAVERGSVQDMVVYPGDPLTPGIGATANAKRLPIAEAATILSIPVLPISRADAQPLLAALGGAVAPAAWRGALAQTYHLGPGPARVRLQVSSDWSMKTLYDVIATLPGRELPDQWIIRGNHRDAWVFGAGDPSSGHVAWLAEAKAIGQLARRGWRPRRTLLYASWDGEEPGLVGSTEWVETHAQELSGKAALYINTDMNMRGLLEADGSQGLRHFVHEAAAALTDPETGTDLVTRAQAAARTTAFDKDQPPPAVEHELPLGALGSGSDFSAFLQHLGIASLDLQFSGEEQYGVYHSAYDSFDHYRRFGDPQFSYGVVMSKLAGHLMLRAAQATLLPFRARDASHGMSTYVQELQHLAEGMRSRAERQRALLQENAFRLAADPQVRREAPAPLPLVPVLDFSPLERAVSQLGERAIDFDGRYDRLLRSADSQSATGRQRCNRLLTALESRLTEPHGLPGRPWYTHMIYAPGFHTGYSVKTMPGVREAIEEGRWDEARHFIGLVAGVLERYGQELESAACR